MRAWWSKLTATWKRQTLERDLRAELEAHLQMEVDAGADQGLDPRRALQEARRHLGSQALILDRSREVWAFSWIETLLQDVRIAARGLRRQPAFSVVAVMILAIGIGGSTAVFGVVNAVLLKPLPFRDPGRIVALRTLWTKTGAHGNVSVMDFHDWQALSTSFDATAFYSSNQSAVTVGSDAQFATVSPVSSGFFAVLGIDPAIGRLFQDGETAPGSSGAAVVSHSFWLTHLRGDPVVLGTTVRVAGRPVPIVGVMPAGFRFPDPTDVWVPADTVFRLVPPNRGAHNVLAIGRLKPSANVAGARAELTRIGSVLEREYPNTNGDKNVSVTPLADEMTRDATTMFYVLLGATFLLLLIACGNVANLLLAKAVGRTREMGLRAALGAGRARIVRQLVTESLVLGAFGGGAGLVLAKLLTTVLITLAPAGVPRLEEAGIDPAVLAFATALTLTACVFFGLVPALRASKLDVHSALKQSGVRTTAGIGSRARLVLVVGEIALSAVLLTGAGLLIRSFDALSHVALGFETERLLVMQTSNPVTFEDAEGSARVVRMYETLLNELARLPGVTNVAAARVPPGRVMSSGAYAVDPGARGGQLTVRSPQAVYSVASPGAFAVLGIPLREGRDFSPSDGPDALRAAIVNETLARSAFPGRDPIGHVIFAGLDSFELMTIVGVVGDIHQRGPSDDGMAEIYMPYQQHARVSTAMSILARTSAPSDEVIETFRRTARRIAPDMPLKFTTMDARLSEDVAVPRFRTVLLTIFAAIALVLTLAGVYGVVSFLVSQRTQEIGVRVALGATKADILHMILRQGLGMAALGSLLGLAGAAGATRFLESLLFGVKPFDPLTFGVVGCVIVLITTGACTLPALRALSIDPSITLRQE